MREDSSRYNKKTMRFMWLSVAALTMVALFSRMKGLNPPSLFIDDLWQGLLSGAALADQFRLRSSAPLGFTSLLGTALRFIPDPEISLQMIPFLAGLAVIPVMALVIFRITKNPPASVLGAALVTCAPPMAELSVRVKQYTLDALLVAVLLLLAIFVGEEKKRFPVFVIVALTFLLFSFSSAVVAVLLITTFAVAQPRHLYEAAQNRRIFIHLVLFMTVTGLYYVLVLKGQKNPALENFWSGYFPGTVEAFFSGLFSLFRSLSPTPGILSPPGAEIFSLLFSFVLILLAVTGAVCLWRKPGYRWLGAGLVLLYPVLGILALLHLYPLGGGRTDLFTYPVTILLVATGLARVFEGEYLRTRRMDWTTLICGLTALPFCLPMALGPQITYPTGGNLPEIVSRAKAALGPADGLIILPHCSFCFAYYSDWPVSLEPCDFYATGFNPVIHKPNVHILPGLVGYGQHPEILIPEMKRIVDRGYPGLVFFTMDIGASNYIDRYLIRAGYCPVKKIENKSIVYVTVYRRQRISD